MMKCKMATLFGVLVTISGWAMAHPGHGLHEMGNGWHPLFGIEHIGLLALLGGVAWALTRRGGLSRRRPDREE